MIQDHRFLGGAARAANRWSDFLETEGFTIQRMAGDQAEGKGLVLTGKPPRGWGRLFGAGGRGGRFRLRFRGRSTQRGRLVIY